MHLPVLNEYAFGLRNRIVQLCLGETERRKVNDFIQQKKGGIINHEKMTDESHSQIKLFQKNDMKSDIILTNLLDQKVQDIFSYLNHEFLLLVLFQR